MSYSNYPSYLALSRSGELEKRANRALDILGNCTLCPWKCGVNRIKNEKGQCQTGRLARVYSFAPHFGEEKPISGNRGSGTIFFSGCSMHCVYCQNSDISQEMYGLEVTDERLANMMLELQTRGCHNINLVTPTHVIPQILQALLLAVASGFNLPLVYNTGGYDSVETLSLLNGIVDIYMPDMKYANANNAELFSGIKDYPTHNQQSIKEMYSQVGDLIINESGIALHGLLIRHLVLPENLASSEDIMNFIANEISIHTYINLMDQYRPAYEARKFHALSQRISRKEFQQVTQQAIRIGLDRIDHLFW